MTSSNENLTQGAPYQNGEDDPSLTTHKIPIISDDVNQAVAAEHGVRPDALPAALPNWVAGIAVKQSSVERNTEA
jgi:hypothetical protein